MKLAADARISSLLLLAVLVRASPESGSVVGTVFDPGGYPLSRASVHLSASNPERNYSGQTDINGRFRIDAVPPGDYKATISLQGFRSSTQNVRVNSGDATDVGAQQLAVGECNTPGGPICDDLYVSQPRRGRNVDRATQDACPNSMALGMLKHRIAYQRTEEYDPLRGLSVIHLDVWMRGPLTGFYILEPMSGAVPTIRDTYLIDEKDGLQGGGSCPLDKSWRSCIEGFADTIATGVEARTCSTTIDLRRIPPWEPSPNDKQKRRIARELRHEIEDRWGEAERIVVRDFNLKDNQLTIYLRTKDGDQYHGCAFHALRTPHCDGWHLFGQAPISSIRKWIFARPYELSEKPVP